MKALIKKYRRVILFGLVGCTNTAVDFLTYTVALKLLMLSVGVSQAIGYTVGLVCSFLLNRRFTFRDGGRRLWGQMILFLLVNLITMGISVLSINLLTGAGMNPLLAKIPVTGIVMVCNYFGYKLIVFQVR
jgi:putative flippase GtrA